MKMQSYNRENGNHLPDAGCFEISKRLFSPDSLIFNKDRKMLKSKQNLKSWKKWKILDSNLNQKTEYCDLVSEDNPQRIHILEHQDCCHPQIDFKAVPIQW